MATKTLTRAWLYAGKTYGPGEVEMGDGDGQMPEDAMKSLEARGAFGADAPAADAPLTRAAPLISTVAHPDDGKAAASDEAPSVPAKRK